MSDSKTKTDLSSLLDLQQESAADLPFVPDPTEALDSVPPVVQELSEDEVSLFDEPMAPMDNKDPLTGTDTTFDLPPMDPDALAMASEPLGVEEHIPSLEAADVEAHELKMEARSSAEARLDESLHPEIIDDVFKDLSPSRATNIEPTEVQGAAEVTTVESPAPITPARPRVEKPPMSGASAIGAVRNYADKVAPSPESLAQVPFSLLIEGRLKVHEREALLSILARENLGIREVELDPQFEAGRVLIPRVSEYVGVILVQALRNADIVMRLGPADEIYAGKEDGTSDDLVFQKTNSTMMTTESVRHPADELPITTEPIIMGKKFTRVIDTIQVSINLKGAQVASASNPAYLEAVQALKRQMKHIAFYRGANTLVSFKTQLHPLEGGTLYKVVAQAVAAVLEDQA